MVNKFIPSRATRLESDQANLDFSCRKRRISMASRAVQTPGKLANDPDKSLRKTVYHKKVKSRKTRLTAIHHLETPANI